VPSKYAPQAKIIHLDIDKAEIDKVIKNEIMKNITELVH